MSTVTSTVISTVKRAYRKQPSVLKVLTKEEKKGLVAITKKMVKETVKARKESEKESAKQAKIDEKAAAKQAKIVDERNEDDFVEIALENEVKEVEQIVIKKGNNLAIVATVV